MAYEAPIALSSPASKKQPGCGIQTPRIDAGRESGVVDGGAEMALVFHGGE